MNVDELTIEVELRKHYFVGFAAEGDASCACGVKYSNWEEHLSIVIMRVIRDDEPAKESVDLHRQIRKLKKKIRKLKSDLYYQQATEALGTSMIAGPIVEHPAPSRGGTWTAFRRATGLTR